MTVASPVFFDGLAGMYHAAPGKTAVLMLSPWAYEELCSRKAFRILAEKLAAQGYPCLRFDFPGTCHSALASDAVSDETAWRRAAEAALDQLIKLSSASRVILIGQGLGGLIAGDLARKRGAAAVVYLGAVSQGRMHLREIAAWTAMTQPTFLVRSSDGPEGGLMAGGFVLSAATANEIKGLNLLKGDVADVERSLVVERPDNPADVKLAEYLLEGGAVLDRLPFHGYVDYISNPTLSILPSETIAAVAAWVARYFPAGANGAGASGDGAARAAANAALPTVLEAAQYKETLCRFGPEEMFFGVLTEPVNSKAATAVLVLNAGYDHSCGWGRYTVDMARELAQVGVAVLRMDLAGMGETPLWPGQPEQVLYSTRQNDDVNCAVEWLRTRSGIQKLILMGRCSGAYQAFVSAALDSRVDGAFLVNSRKLVWDPEENVDQAIREPIQTLETYRSKMTDPKQFKRLLSGELTVSAAMRKVFRALLSAADRKLAPVLGNLSRHRRLGSVVYGRLKVLADRHTPVAFVYSQGDRGLIETTGWFGENAAGLSSYPNVSFTLIPDADHNLSPLPARAAVTAQLKTFLSKFEDC